MRTPERTLVSIPNGEFSKVQIENLAPRDKLLLRTELSLGLETSDAQLRTVLARLKEVTLKDPHVDKESARIRLVALGPLTINLEVFVYVMTRDWNEFLEIKETLYLQYLAAIESSDTRLAPPSHVHVTLVD